MDIEQIIYMQNLLNDDINLTDSTKPLIKKKRRSAVTDEYLSEDALLRAKLFINKEISFKVFISGLSGNICTAIFMENDFNSKKIIKDLYQAYTPEYCHMITNKFTFLVPNKTRTVFYDRYGAPCISDQCVNQICKITMKPGIFKNKNKNAMHLNVYRIQET